MIYVTQGHCYGIGLETFLKAYLCQSHKFREQIILICHLDDLKINLNFMPYKNSIYQDHIFINKIKLNCIFFEKSHTPNSTTALHIALGLCKPNDILLTLPTSKDQIFYNKKQLNGHTEFFRKFFKQENLVMSFLAPDCNFLLLTDHIAIEDVSKKITQERIFQKVDFFIRYIHQSREIKEVFFSGINPHCGENGHISNDDSIIQTGASLLRKKFDSIVFHSMMAGDTLHFNIKNKNQLFVYSAHDQGLAPFKLKYGLIGINLTLGMPFRRVSVDHGTAFDLWGKNKANYAGMLYLMEEIKNWK
ncbi:MAG: 4-hydroxythreonine-4-phosphate dehydrogenase PdxA [Bacteriovoracaceae bacterium]|jgi:4-hydroxythreonine-4-phosphate dehydrogenase|nr:hypothetical protein [Halobacteriovoraceae bacterium]MDP7321952.1 4-hydroxythreonine-4-phosphate dehydrogenase PdxA [Bacteriovoracaceae bacterium]